MGVDCRKTSVVIGEWAGLGVGVVRRHCGRGLHWGRSLLMNWGGGGLAAANGFLWVIGFLSVIGH